jgi:hypothetical protein
VMRVSCMGVAVLCLLCMAANCTSNNACMLWPTPQLKQSNVHINNGSKAGALLGCPANALQALSCQAVW